jgi:hypothetical protein
MRPENSKSRLALVTAVTAFVFGLAGGAAADQPSNLADAFALAAEENQVLVVDFFTEW